MGELAEGRCSPSTADDIPLSALRRGLRCSLVRGSGESPGLTARCLRGAALPLHVAGGAADVGGMRPAVVAHLLLSVALAAPTGSTLDRMKAWIGDAKAVAAVAGYDATADCLGPRGPYRTRIAVRRSDAWTRFTQWKDGALSWDSVALGRNAWERDDDGSWKAGDDEGRARILGHQFLWMVLAPEEVFHSFGEPRSGTLDGAQVEWIPAKETRERPVELAVDATGRPVALRVEHGGQRRNPAHPVVVVEARAGRSPPVRGGDRAGTRHLQVSVREDGAEAGDGFRLDATALTRVAVSAGDRPAGATATALSQAAALCRGCCTGSASGRYPIRRAYSSPGTTNSGSPACSRAASFGPRGRTHRLRRELPEGERLLRDDVLRPRHVQPVALAASDLPVGRPFPAASPRTRTWSRSSRRAPRGHGASGACTAR